MEACHVVDMPQNQGTVTNNLASVTASGLLLPNGLPVASHVEVDYKQDQEFNSNPQVMEV